MLPPEESPPILRAVARAHFLEGDMEAAVETLTRALALEPESPEIRELLRLLLDQLGRAGEMEELVAAAAAADPLPAGVRQPREPGPPPRQPCRRTYRRWWELCAAGSRIFFPASP